MRGISHSGALAAAVAIACAAHAKPCIDLAIAAKGEIASTCATMTVTMLHDATRPFLYVANKEAGLKIHSVSNPASPAPVAAIPTVDLGKLEVMNVSQSGNLLFLALGNHFTNPQAGGLGIVDVTDPAHPAVKDVYVVPGSKTGAGIAVAEGKYAYLGAMQSGLAVLDVSDPSDIKSLALFQPDRNYPVANPNAELYNVRGFEVKDAIVYMAFDAGGVRIVDCRKPEAPKEIGRFANPALYKPFNLPRAYNNLVLDGNRIFAAVDYCGMETLKLTPTGDSVGVALEGWWNPYKCPDNNWFTSPVHANEIRMDKACRRLFLATGKSDLYVLDVADPAHPDSCDGFGGNGNGLGTWGVGLWQDQIQLSYICTLGIPFASDWTGVKLLTFNNACATAVRPARTALGKITLPASRVDASGRRLPDVPFANLADIPVFSAPRPLEPAKALRYGSGGPNDAARNSLSPTLPSP